MHNFDTINEGNNIKMFYRIQRNERNRIKEKRRVLLMLDGNSCD